MLAEQFTIQPAHFRFSEKPSDPLSFTTPLPHRPGLLPHMRTVGNLETQMLKKSAF